MAFYKVTDESTRKQKKAASATPNYPAVENVQESESRVIYSAFDISELTEEILFFARRNQPELHVSQMVSVSNLFYSLANPRRITEKLLLHVTHGGEEMVKKLLELTPYSHLHYLVKRAAVIDYSGREFCRISAFQYALWAMDIHMLNLMLRCLQNAAYIRGGYTVAEEIRKQLLAQYDEVMQKGINYTLEGILIQGESHFDFQPLIRAIDFFSKGYRLWDWKQREQQWVNGVGKKQLLIPAHVAQEYCRTDRALYPCPSFNEENLPRSLEFYNWRARCTESWWSKEGQTSNIGREFAMLRSTHCQIMAVGASIQRHTGLCNAGISAKHDAKALTALSQVRINDVVRLRKRLSTPLKLAEYIPDRVACYI